MIRIRNVLLIGLISSVLFLQLDDDLDPESIVMLDAATPKEASSAWFFLMGIASPPDADPLRVGRKRFEAIVRANAQMNRTRDVIEVVDVPDATALNAPKGSVHCRLKESSCLEGILNHSQEIASELETHQTLIDRYQTFIAMRGYRSLIPVARDLPIPPFHYVVEGSRLVGLEAIHESILGNHDRAVELLTTNELNLREHLTESDDLIYTLILYASLSENIDRLVVVDQLSDRQLTALSELSEEETHFERILAREFKFIKEGVDDIYIRQNHETIGYTIVKPLMRMFVKPNMSANLTRLALEENIRYSELSQFEFEQSAITSLEKHSSLSDWIRNFAPTAIVENPIDYRRYFARTHDLNTKIKMYNHRAKATGVPAQDVLNSFVNPYYDEAGYAYFSEDSSHMCFKGPIETNNGIQCLLHIDKDTEFNSYVDLSID